MATLPNSASNLIPIKVTQLMDAPVASEDGLILYVYNGNTYKIRVGDLLNVSGVPLTRQVIAGTSLTGGGPLSSDVTLSVAPGGIGTTQLASSGVTPGAYGSSTVVPVITVDATGRVTSITTTTVDTSGGVPPTRQVIAGTGLTGGGALSADVTLSAALSAETPLYLFNTGSAGASDLIARADHQHPAVDLADDTQVDGLLGLNSGGTARSLVPEAGALVWSGADGLYIGTAGVAGQVPVSGGSGEYTWGSVLIMTDQPANVVYAGPASGPDGPTGFRALVNADLPTSLTDLTGGISTPDFVQFDTSATPVTAVGKLQWDPTDSIQTLSVGMAGGSVVQQIGEETFFRVKASSAITNGQAVMFTGTVGASGGLLAAPASGLTDSTSTYFIGVATEDIAHNSWGYVTSFGEVRGVNTTGGTEAWVDGQILYYNPAVPGGLTKTVPEAPAAKIQVAVVVHAAAGPGSLFVRPTINVAIEDLNNVQTSAASAGDLLQYSGTYWRHLAASSITVGNVSGTVTIANGGTGQTSKTPAFDALSPLTTQGDIIVGGAAGTGTRLAVGTANTLLHGGTTPSYSAVTAADAPTLVPYTVPQDLQEWTGFLFPGTVLSTYDSVARTVTLTSPVVGELYYYWQGAKTLLGDGTTWTSSAHDATTGGWFLSSADGTTFTWAQTPWAFYQLMVAFVYYGVTDRFGLRETHGTMPWQAHQEFHQTLGTYLTAGGDLGGYTLASTTPAARRPTVSVTTIKDEDIETDNPELSSSLYTKVFLTETGVTTFTVETADIVPLLGDNPYYNQFVTPNWVQTLVPNNNYMNVWLVAVPAQTDVTSQKYRYLWIQGQETGTLAAMRAVTSASVNVGTFVDIFTEFVFIGKVIIRYTGGNWQLTEVSKLTGTRISQASVSGGYLSAVTTDSTLTGAGTGASPLGVNPVSPISGGTF